MDYSYEYLSPIQFSNSNWLDISEHSFPTESNHYQNISYLSTDGALRFIDEMLMEEETNDDTNHLLESSDFHAKERSFYEVLGQEYPPLQNHDHATNPNAVVTSSNDELDAWTYIDAGTCEQFAAYISDLRNASNAAEKDKIKNKSEPVDLRALLMSCAQSVVLDKRDEANEILRQIRPHAYQYGDKNQRVAHYMVSALEARLSGTGSLLHKAFAYDRMSTSDYFTAYCTSFISSSFRRISVFASNKLIATKSKKSERLHIIDFGILHGFQWPAFIRRLAEREGGPPMLRITGLDFPNTGCEEAERMNATRGRLVHYAEMFKVPFEYNGIVKRWESVSVEELGIEEGEFVAVNCMFRAENIAPDEVDVSNMKTESPRSRVLELIRKINPDIFVNGVVHGGYGAPYFLTRFREALFHYSTLFDMAETIIPKERQERLLMEGILGNEVMEVVACEGTERVLRPETCGQWQVRHTRAGLKQVRFGRKLLGSMLEKVRSCFHRDFVVVEDNRWLMMSWKGRTICALSCWKPSATKSLLN